LEHYAGGINRLDAPVCEWVPDGVHQPVHQRQHWRKLYDGAALDGTFDNPSVNVRGNQTQIVTPSGTTNTTYDVTGTPTGANDNLGHAVSVSTASGTNFSAPSLIQPNTGNQTVDGAPDFTPFVLIRDHQRSRGGRAGR
jgi:hypothetical protein